MDTVEKGTKIKIHYKGTLEDGTEFDNSKDRGATLDFEVGAGQMIKGFDSNVLGMGEGEVRTFTLEPEEGSNGQGQPMLARISNISDDGVLLDLNHPLAGKNLTFEVELIEIEA